MEGDEVNPTCGKCHDPVRIRMVMAAVIRIADMEKELESFARDIIGEISGGGNVYWPRLHRKILEV